MARGILFTGNDLGGAVQIQGLSPVVTISKNASGQIRQIQITIRVTAGQEHAAEPMIGTNQAFINLKGTSDDLVIEAAVGTILFQQDGSDPSFANLSFGMKSSGGKVGGPGFLVSKLAPKRKKK